MTALTRKLNNGENETLKLKNSNGKNLCHEIFNLVLFGSVDN